MFLLLENMYSTTVPITNMVADRQYNAQNETGQ